MSITNTNVLWGIVMLTMAALTMCSTPTIDSSRSGQHTSIGAGLYAARL